MRVDRDRCGPRWAVGRGPSVQSRPRHHGPRASSEPGGRAGMVVADGFRLDNGPDGADDAEPARGHVQRGRRRHGRLRHDRAGRPDVPGGLRRRVDAVRPPRSRGDDRGDPARSPDAKDAAAFGRFCDWLADLYRAEMASFIDANFDSPLDLVKPWRAGLELVKLGGFGNLGKKVASFFDDERLRGSSVPVDVRRARPVRSARALRRDHLHGLGRGRVRARGRHAHDGHGSRRRGRAGRRRHPATTLPVTSITRAADGSVTGVVVDGDGTSPADAVVCNADLPVAYRELLPTSTPRGSPAAASTRRRVCCGSPGCAACRRRTPPITTSTSVHDWDGSFKALIDDGVRMPDPSILVTLHSLDDPHARAGRLFEHLRARAHAEPAAARRDRLGARARPDRRRPATPHRVRSDIPTDVVVERGVRPDRLGTHGNGARHPVRARPHVPADRARSDRTTSIARRPGSCSPARRRSPASACRWCSCRASWPQQRVDEYAAARRRS